MPRIIGTAKRLRIYLCEQDRWKESRWCGKPTFHEIVNKAKELGIAGATVFRGLMGYGSSSLLHTARLADIPCNLPIIVEIIDSEENINRLLPHLDDMIKEGLLTIDDIDIIKYSK